MNNGNQRIFIVQHYDRSTLGRDIMPSGNPSGVLATGSEDEALGEINGKTGDGESLLCVLIENKPYQLLVRRWDDTHINTDDIYRESVMLKVKIAQNS